MKSSGENNDANRVVIKIYICCKTIIEQRYA